MREIATLNDIAEIREAFDVECKLAQGRDGKGQLPDDIWESYSAFANTFGGDIFLGLREEYGETYVLAGIEDTGKVLKELWHGLQDPDNVSSNILLEHWVKVISIAGKNVIHIHVPRAPAKQRPVYLRGDPLQGSYRRFNSADMRMSEDVVKRMMAEEA
ncbi:MAG: AlbA family DNA-binding domain-containing protein [Arenicella sp.]